MSDQTNTAKTAGRSRKPALTPEQRQRKRIIQISVGVVVLALVVVLAVLAQGVNPRGAFIIMIGTAFGYTLQRSRFCFTASLRDPVLTGGTDLTKAVIIAFALSTALFTAINMSKFGMALENYAPAEAAGYIRPVGIHTAIGAFLFGIGAVLAGGCASGTLMRMGEGFAQQWIAFVFFVVGSILGGFIFAAMKTVPFLFNANSAVFLPVALGGWVPALIVQFGLLLILYVGADLWGKKKAGAL